MRRYLFLFAASLGAAPAAAQDFPPDDDARESSITVVASGNPDFLADTGQRVTIIGAEEIGAVQGADIVRVLERAPGVTASRNGGLGGFTGIRVRGAEAEQLLVLVDGVRLADPGSPGAGFDFGTLLPYGIGKIELLRGSNSTIWGSQAVGGVLAVTSAEVQGIRAMAEYGAHDSLSGSLAAGTGWATGAAGLTAATVETDGFSTAADGSEADGFRQWQLAGRVSQDLTQALTVDVSGRFAHGRLDLDGFPAPEFVFADTDEYQVTRQASGRVGARLQLADLALTGGVSLAETRREQFDPALGSGPGYMTEGRSERAELRGQWDLAPAAALRFGAEREWSRFESTTDSRKRAAITGAYAQLGLQRGSLAVNLGLRRDDHRSFGGEWSLGADGRLAVVGGWHLHASYGEGFKAPSLFQLFSDYGNAALQPERSRSFDLGVGTGDRNASTWLDLTLFRRATRDAIGFVSCFGATDGICSGRPFGTYDNIGRARAQGIEAEAGVRPFAGLGLSAAYAYIEAVDRTPGASSFDNDLARRPRHALTLTGEWRAAPELTLSADLRAVSRSFDDAANAVRLGGYEVVTVRGDWALSERVALFGRIENLLEETYQTAAGYATAGRGAYLGVRARL